jgi:NADH-quinone oxidoreductase subunit J
MEWMAFSLGAACAVLAALAVVRSANLVHAVLWLGCALLATAALFAMLGESFLAGVQVLLYVGGVVTLMVFGVMITRRHDGPEPVLQDKPSASAAGIAIVFFVLVCWAVLTTDGLDAEVPIATPAAPEELGRLLLRDHVLAFETISDLLLVAIVGAIVIARRRDPGLALRPTVAWRPDPSGTARMRLEAAERALQEAAE